MADDEYTLDEIGDHFQRCVDEYLFDVNGDGCWRVYVGGRVGELFDVDQGVVPENGAACVLVRRSDSKRFEVWAHVTVSPCG